jgi:hypothetical protein
MKNLVLAVTVAVALQFQRRSAVTADTKRGDHFGVERILEGHREGWILVQRQPEGDHQPLYLIAQTDIRIK